MPHILKTPDNNFVIRNALNMKLFEEFLNYNNYALLTIWRSCVCVSKFNVGISTITLII